MGRAKAIDAQDVLDEIAFRMQSAHGVLHLRNPAAPLLRIEMQDGSEWLVSAMPVSEVREVVAYLNDALT